MQRMDFFFLSYLPKPRSGCSADTFFWHSVVKMSIDINDSNSFFRKCFFQSAVMSKSNLVAASQNQRSRAFYYNLSYRISKFLLCSFQILIFTEKISKVF